MDLPDVVMTSQFIRRGPTAIELLAFSEPSPFGDRERRAVNQLGLTHLSFRVDDVATTAARIVELGGAVVEPSRTTIDFGGSPLEFVYCTDPDGVRVELMDLGT
jgi:lactoylglutathione lyase